MWDEILYEADELAMKLVPMLDPWVGGSGLVVTENSCAVKQMSL